MGLFAVSIILSCASASAESEGLIYLMETDSDIINEINRDYTLGNATTPRGSNIMLDSLWAGAFLPISSPCRIV